MKKLLLVLFFHAAAFAQSPGERMIADYFRNHTRRVAENSLAQIRTLEGEGPMSIERETI